MPNRIIQWLRSISATCGAVLLAVNMTLVSFKQRSVMRTTN